MSIQSIQAISSTEIGELDRAQTVDASSVAAEATSSTSSKESLAAAAQSDQTSLSMASQLMTQASSLPDVDQEKVTAVQSAFAAGTYQVSSEDVAASVIESLKQ